MQKESLSGNESSVKYLPMGIKLQMFDYANDDLDSFDWKIYLKDSPSFGRPSSLNIDLLQTIVEENPEQTAWE